MSLSPLGERVDRNRRFFSRGGPGKGRHARRTCVTEIHYSRPSRQDISHKRKSACQREQKDLLGNRSLAMGLAFVFAALIPCLEHEHRGVFREVDAALVAFAAVTLNVTAGGTGEPKRRVAARAELRLLGILMKALGASHSLRLGRRWVI